ncbi:Uncharacterised protein [Bacillus subtilis]|nr:Uncharacterised protein [Bacillus subtilis]
MNRMIFPAWRISSMTFFRRSSNSPRYFVPATTVPMSNVITRLSRKISGTSLLIICCAKPSAIAVLPTPGSPMRTGLFFVLRLNTSMTRWISLLLPITGSRLSSFAIAVKSLAKLSSVGVFALLFVPAADDPVSLLPRSWSTCCLALFKLTPRLFRTLAATPSPSRIRPRRICSVPT